MIRLESDGITVAAVMSEHGYQLSEDRIHWVYTGLRGESRIGVGFADALLRESGGTRFRMYVRQERDRAKGEE